ncbi:MAG: polysaccharide biosynthesis tyrosine autokinase, partial [Myxococcota bacterium]
SRLSEARSNRISLEAMRDQARRARSEELAAESIESVAQSSVVQNLKQSISSLKQELAELSIRYTEKHPRLVEVRKKVEALKQELKDEVDTLLTGAEERYRTMKETEGKLRAAIEQTKAEALEVNKKEIEYTRLQREATNYASLYDLVLKRQKETDLTTLLNVNNVRKFEAAKAPTVPIKPKPSRNLTMSLFLGLALGVGLAFLIDMLDNTVKSQKQVEEQVDIPFLGIVPMIKLGRGPRKPDDSPARDHYILENPRSAVAECTRTIRTNLMFMSPENPARFVVVTSSSPREGKSTTAINLAIVTAQSGKRTLIVDTDMRRPRLHKSFAVPNDVGISSYIVGEANLDQAVQRSNVPGLDVMTCGPIPPNPAELLHTEAFERLLDELRQRYDRVVFDSPPVTAVTDSLVLSSMMDGVVLVIHANITTLHSAQVARRRVEDVGGRIFGAVLNDVDLDDRRTSEYYQQYYYYYRSPYVDEEQLSKEARG